MDIYIYVYVMHVCIYIYISHHIYKDNVIVKDVTHEKQHNLSEESGSSHSSEMSAPLGVPTVLKTKMTATS